MHCTIHILGDQLLQFTVLLAHLLCGVQRTTGVRVTAVLGGPPGALQMLELFDLLDHLGLELANGGDLLEVEVPVGQKLLHLL